MNTPSEIDCWNWGAFWLGPFWSLGNRVREGLCCWVPFPLALGLMVIVFFLGDVLFKTIQRLWAIVAWTVGTPVLFIPLVRVLLDYADAAPTYNDQGFSESTLGGFTGENWNAVYCPPNASTMVRVLNVSILM